VTGEIERVFREEYGRAVAVLVRAFRDIGAAEEAVQDAFAVAMERWPSEGIPPSPAGWIVTTARNRAIDRLRREASRTERQTQAAWLWYANAPPPVPGSDDMNAEEGFGDDRLRLIFTCCHPALALPAQVALTLRLLGGLTTAENRSRLPGAGAHDGAAAWSARRQNPRCQDSRTACPTTPIGRPDFAASSR
jgi:RNA polymerase sigma-70 factor (ECF subfamily)